MHDVESKNHALHGCLREVHLKSFNAHVVIWQFIDKLKLVLLFAAQYLTEWLKMTVILVSYGISSSILPAS